MRRNLTISFAEDYIKRMDADRGKTSRGKWIERLNAPTGGIWDDPPYIAEVKAAARVSPQLRFGIKPRPRGKE